MLKTYGNTFYGYELSEYAKENGFVDYRTFAKAVGDAVLNNDIMAKTDGVVGYWEQVGGFVDNSDEIDELYEEIERLNATLDEVLEDGEAHDAEEREIEDEIRNIADKIDELREEMERPCEIFQYYIVGDNGAQLLIEADEIVFYNDELDLYLWGVTHWGTSWDYVLTNIPVTSEAEFLESIA